MPISSATYERPSFEVKIIKNYHRNSITDSHSSDLTILAVERGFAINYERVTEKIPSNHKNCTILL
jgi:hypothetical protein